VLEEALKASPFFVRQEHPVMEAVLSRQRLVLATGASVVGIIASWLTTTPFGLLAPIAVLPLYAEGRSVLLLHVTLAIAFVCAALAALLDLGGMHGPALFWATFFALALCITAVVAATLAAPVNNEPIGAARIIERVVGNAWAADAAGKFTYVTPAALTFLGMTLEDLNATSNENAFGWKRVIHPEDYDAAAAAWRRSLQTGDPYNVEHRMLRANGTYGWGRSLGQPSRDSQGRITGWYGTVIDSDGPSVVNERSIGATGFVLEGGTAPDGWLSLSNIHPHDRPAAAQAAAYAFWTGVPQLMSYRQRQPDGSYRLTEFRAEPGYGVSVNVDAMVSRPEERWTVSDAFGETTEAVRAAKIIESLFGKAWAFDAAGQFTYVTPVAQTAIGMTLDDLNAPVRGGAFVDGGDTGWSRGVHADDYERAAAGLRHSLKTGDHWNAEYRMLRATGQYVWHRVAARPTRDSQGRITGWYGTSIDIDVYKRTEAALRDRERELSQLVDMVPSHLWRLTPDGEPIFFNKRMVDFLGLDVADTDRPGMTRLAVMTETAVHPDDAAAFADALSHCLVTGKSFAMRYRLRRFDGVYRWMSSRAEPMRDQTGRIIQWYGLCHDIDDQMHAEEALRESERSLRQLVETLPALIYCAAPDGKPIYRSRQLRDFLGMNLEDKDEPGRARLASTLDAIIHPDDLAAVKERYGHSLSTGEPYALQHRLRRFDGEYRWVETRTAAMRNAQGMVVQWNGVCLDIEDQVRAQEKLRLAQEGLARASEAARLAELSASIAHEVNQPLAAVVANSHACERWLMADPPNIERAQKTVERIIRDANAAADVVGRIRALFKQSVDSRRDTALRSVIAEVCELMAEEAARRRVRMNIEIQNDLPSLTLDRVQIQQVLINLVRNGMEAMEAGTADRILGIRVRQKEGTVQTEVSDRGPGIEFPARIFEPFFTTKQSGMGMGLAICRSIIESHGGRLWVEKNEPNGAKFIFTLPTEAKTTS
jgi:PAS domain S-box-containing protein